MPVWLPAGAGPGWLAAWHGFGWLADLISVGAAARDPARALVQSWLADNAAWHPRRLALGCRRRPASSPGSCISTRSPAREVDRALRRAMLASIAAQVRHLSRTAAWELAGAARLRALKGLIGGLAALGGSEKRISRALQALERELPIQILPDGGHRSRNPSVQLAVLRDLIDLRAVLRAAHVEVPAAVAAGDRAHGADAAVLPPWRSPARAVQRFGRGGRGHRRSRPDPLGDRAAIRRRRRRMPGSSACRPGKSLVLVDTGKPPPRGFDEDAHAGTLSFELSQGRERIIVNCGGYRGAKPAWRRVARASAAHSVLVVGDTNSTEIRADGALGRTPGTRCAASAPKTAGINGSRRPMTATASAFRPDLCARSCILAADGEDLRGEDKLTGRAGAAFAVRFHLHPAVEASLVEEGGGALLRLPSGAVWRLRAAGAEMSLGESIYLGAGELRKTQQVVLSGIYRAERRHACAGPCGARQGGRRRTRASTGAG